MKKDFLICIYVITLLFLFFIGNVRLSLFASEKDVVEDIFSGYLGIDDGKEEKTQTITVTCTGKSDITYNRYNHYYNRGSKDRKYVKLVSDNILDKYSDKDLFWEEPHSKPKPTDIKLSLNIATNNCCNSIGLSKSKGKININLFLDNEYCVLYGSLSKSIELSCIKNKIKVVHHDITKQVIEIKEEKQSVVRDNPNIKYINAILNITTNNDNKHCIGITNTNDELIFTFSLNGTYTVTENTLSKEFDIPVKGYRLRFTEVDDSHKNEKLQQESVSSSILYNTTEPFDNVSDLDNTPLNSSSKGMTTKNINSNTPYIKVYSGFLLISFISIGTIIFIITLLIGFFYRKEKLFEYLLTGIISFFAFCLLSVVLMLTS